MKKNELLTITNNLKKEISYLMIKIYDIMNHLDVIEQKINDYLKPKEK